ncbi:MAG: lysylphosphatidylglycerol synthase domain-containing protein [Planctomycetota bacterium]
MRLLKVCVAFVVVVGLASALRTAWAQWHQQIANVQVNLRTLDQQIAMVNDPQAIGSLEEDRRRLTESIPAWSRVRWGYAMCGCCLYAAALLPPGVLLRRTVVALGSKTTLAIALAAQVFGHVGKYVPGKAMVVVLRSKSLRDHGVTTAAATAAVFVETLMMMAVGAAISGGIICFLPIPGWMILVAIGIAATATLGSVMILHPRIVTRILGKGIAATLGSRQRLHLILSAWIWSGIAWLLIGGSFMMLTAAIEGPQTPLTLSRYAVSTAAISLAMVVGFASLLPGGAGARELVLTTLLTPVVGAPLAIFSAIAARLMCLVVEVLMSLAAWGWLRRQGRQQVTE